MQHWRRWMELSSAKYELALNGFYMLMWIVWFRMPRRVEQSHDPRIPPHREAADLAHGLETTIEGLL